MRKLAFILALAVAPAAAQEPLTLFDIPFNQPLNLPECEWRETEHKKPGQEPTYSRSYESFAFTDFMCFAQPDNIGRTVVEGTYRVYFPMEEAPTMGLVSAKLLDGRIQQLYIRTKGIESQDLVFIDLKAKFGEPTLTARPVLQNAMGAAYGTIQAEWDLSDGTRVVFGSAIESLDEGIVVILSPELAAAEKAKKEEQRARRRQL